ncbi:MAG: guanine deaminase [Candidatus Dactylopiibacterium carminicum]|uniref:Guanine deaminase n=1 Tax=Candidatus Dactylopiibacterium carminicum TaxID=857335 RepID=A0A272EQW8_9RHOO|nr:guanine deaminase [Candidatus Dactylopiibacterium carminicum]KAF7598692.1 guanine deaminase [Candidatus Dactylopiibacterium carminicum]PAS92509.1 MAG: guanine deaminase [Candidatus Dactylopiibacterium carminicum]PAS96305.1 MAG: guanine deaminase [Candidatus Dactylopiibacterium carminicum]PAS98559.1 MAG: guanine deaminase [Candidatus Dactylopiibacterium carminicum]
MNQANKPILVRGRILHFLRDPGHGDPDGAYEFIEDGALLIEHGRVRSCGQWDDVLASLPGLTRESARYFSYCDKLIVPGFVDTHVHFPQVGVLGSFGRQLLDWLRDYTFPAEAACADPAVAARIAEFFVDRLLAHGTTTASVYATVHAHSVDAFFTQAGRHNLRMLCGKVLMDRNCPDYLRDTPQQAFDESQALIARWHGKGRLDYVVTPRFAPTSTPEQLAVAGELFRSRPGVRLQSHLSETLAEIAWVRELYPEDRDYLAVYERFGLTGVGSIYGHGIHLGENERRRLAESRTAIALCPTSNQFLGSGAADEAALAAAGVPLGLATDVGGGTSLSMLRTMGAAYVAAQAHGHALTPWRAWYLATLGGASALCLDEKIGSFAQGKEADFVVLDSERIPELAWRLKNCKDLGEELFAMMILGDERCVLATHVMGERQAGVNDPA